MASYQDLLRPQVLTRVVKQVVGSADNILNFMGFAPGGTNEIHMGHGREGIYHVYDDSRKVAKGRAPGTAAGRSSKQNMKAVPFVYPRMHDSVSLSAEFIHNLGRIDDPATRDIAGRDMISRQTNTLGQRGGNWRVAQTVGMLRDSLYVHQDGDDWYFNYTNSGNLLQINWNMPAGNKSQLNMTDRSGTSVHSGDIIDVSWDNASANIPKHIAKISQARAVQGVGPVTDIHCTSILWQNVIANDYIAAYAGISQAPFQTFTRENGTRPDGSPQHEYLGSINSLPGITWHISDEGLELFDGTNYTFTKHWEDTGAVFMGNPKASDTFSMMTGSEPIAEVDGGPKTVRVGVSAWSTERANPTATELYILDNALAVNHDPYSVAYGTVVF